MYEFLFYTLLLISSLGSYALWRKKLSGTTPYTKIGVWSGRLLLLLIALPLWTLQGLRWFAPKGSWLYEAAHVTEYYFKIYHVDPPQLVRERLLYGDDPRHYMLVCRAQQYPAPPQDKIIFFVHGGGWHVGSPGLHLHIADVLAARGYWVVMPAYRLGPDNGNPELMADIRQAFGRMLQWRKDQHLDDRGIVIGGTSAGANLAALLWYDEHQWNTTVDSATTQAVKGFFSIAGVLNMDEMPDSKAVHNYAGDRNSAQFKASNPFRYLPARPQTPMLCLHGTDDGLVPYTAAATFVTALQKQHTPVELHTIEGGTHLSVAGQWYYDRSSNYHQQEEILSKWLESL